MAKIYFFFIPIVLIWCLTSCNQGDTIIESDVSTEEKDTTDLILNLSIKPLDMAVGYGNIYSCKVVEAEKGFVEDTLLSVVIIGSENEKDSVFHQASISGYMLKAGFEKYREDEPYRMMPIDGFVDADNTSWKISWIEPIRMK